MHGLCLNRKKRHNYAWYCGKKIIQCAFHDNEGDIDNDCVSRKKVTSGLYMTLIVGFENL